MRWWGPNKIRRRELEEARGQLAACAASNNRLNSELEARTRELTATGDVLKVISRSAFDLQTVLNTLTESAARLCGADTAIIRRREGDAYPVAATYGLTEKQRDHFAIYPTSPSRESVFGRAVMECRTIHVPDVLADPEYNRPQLQDFVAVRAMLGVPLIRDGVPVGVFTLQRREPQPYSQQQIDLVTTFADQAMIAIENVRLFQEVQARTAEAQELLEYQTATADVLNVISRAPSQLQPVFEAIVETAARLCEADSATVFQLADDGRYHLTASHGYSPEYRELLMRRPLSSGRDTAIGRMAVECKTIQIEDTLSDPEYMFHEAQKLGGYRSILAVPLLRDGKAIAGIALGRSAVRPFSAKQIQLVETFADQAVIAINNVGLFEEVQARTAELQESLEYQTAASDVLNVISRAPSELHPVFDAIVETAARLCQAEYALVHMLRDGEYHMTAANNAAADYVKYVRDHPLAPERGSLVGRTALDGRTIHVPDCLADPEYTALGHQRAGGFRTMLGVPLVRTGKTIGVILLMRNLVKPFADKQIELVTTFADQAVIAIKNVRPVRGGAGANGRAAAVA